MPPATDRRMRTRRWDAVVLGSALPGLAAAVRMAMGGLRVLVIEEHAASQIPEHLRDPFFLPAGDVLQHCFGALGVRAMDPRVLGQNKLAYQVLLTKARLDIREPEHNAAELTNWRFAELDDARVMQHAFFEAGEREAQTLLEKEWLRADVSPVPERHRIFARFAKPEARAVAREMQTADGDLQRYLKAQWRVLARGASATPTPRAAARLLGGAMRGGVRFTPESGSLRAVLKQRFLKRRGEIRAHAGEFEFAQLGDAGGVVLLGEREEMCLGRVLLLNASDERLLAACEAWGKPAPDFVRRTRRAPPLRRVATSVRVARSMLPASLAPRAIWWPEISEVPNPVEISRFAVADSELTEELVLASTFPNAGVSDKEQTARVFEAANSLLDLHGITPKTTAAERPLWDDDALHFDPHPHLGWPGAVEIRAGAKRSSVFRLTPEPVFGLGVEGELLLGLRAADALHAKLR